MTISYTNGVPNRPADALLRSRSTAEYDDRGRVFRTALLVPPRQAGYGSPLLQEWRHPSEEAALAHHDELVARLHNENGPAAARAEEASHGCHCH